MKAPVLLFSMVALLALNELGKACVNTQETDAFDQAFTQRLLTDLTVQRLQDRRDRAYWEKRERELRRLLRPGSGAAVRTDYAGVLIHLGRAAEARTLLEEAEKADPGRWYGLAANLGTACELLGDNAEALRWIQEGLRRNPKGHSGTEWLHVKILEAKLALEKNPDWLAKHRVTGADFGSRDEPQKLQGLDPNMLAKALFYQLHERLEFVAAPDAVVGDLLADLSDLLAVHGSAQAALPMYELALSFQPARQETIKRRRDALQQRRLTGAL